jgi:single-stranded-DNA-specific exonuclease
MGDGERHLAMRVHQGGVTLRSVAFGRGDWAAQLDHERGVYDFAFRPVINHFRGRRNVELQIIDWRESVVASPVAE